MVQATERPLHVMFLVVSASVGGAETHAVTLAQALDRRRFSVSLVYLKDEAEIPGAFDDEQCRVSAFCLNARNKLDLGAARRLADYAAQREVDIVVCANPYPLIYAWAVRLLSRRRLRVVEILHSTEPFTRRAWLQMYLYRPLMWMSDLLVFVCKNQRSYWETQRVRARSSQVVHNGVDLGRFRNDFGPAQISAFRRAHGFAGHDYVVGVCGILRQEKGHQDLLRALHMARTAGTCAKCLMIGDGPMRPAIESTIDSLRLTGDVAITGVLADVRLAIASCDVIVVPSHNETFSIAALEAMALGKPLIMADVGGASEQVEHSGNGYLYPKADVAALSDRILRMADPGCRSAFGAASLRKVIHEFSLTRMVDAYVRELIDLARD